MLVPLETARRLLEEARFRAPRVVDREVGAAVGALVATDLRARSDRPRSAVSAMDGYAVRADRSGRRRSFELLGPEADPGGGRTRPLREGEARPIATGSPLPAGANAVVRLEAALADGDVVRVHGPVRRGQDVMPRGESIRRRELIVGRGEELRPYHLSALLADGVRSVPTFDLTVSVLPVGDDLLDPTRPDGPSPSDTVGPVLRGVFGFATVRLQPPVGDDLAAVRDAVAGAAGRSDLVVTIGGSSVGEGDVTKRALAGVGELLFEGVRVNVLKRGAVARVRGRPVLVLPGQLVSAVTNAHEHGLHLLGRMVGRELRAFERATLARSVAVNHRMDAVYLFRVQDGRAEPLPWGVARTGALLRANAFGVLRHGRAWRAGERVSLQRLRGS